MRGRRDGPGVALAWEVGQPEPPAGGAWGVGRVVRWDAGGTALGAVEEVVVAGGGGGCREHGGMRLRGDASQELRGRRRDMERGGRVCVLQFANLA